MHVVANTDRQRGGQNNKKGNRYEDHFSVCRCLELAPGVMSDGSFVSFREQSGCIVDDLHIRENERHHYYQLKNDAGITWGEKGGKLRDEFAEQLEICTAAGQDHTLTVVVSHADRKSSLDTNMPSALAKRVTVRLFAAVRRPSELATLPEIREVLSELSASRTPSVELFSGLAQGFHLAWVETLPGPTGEIDLADIISFVRDQPAFRLRRCVPGTIHAEWGSFTAILEGIPGLKCYTDRGYFEWECGRERGLFPHVLDGQDFGRFVDRVLQKVPETIDDFVGLL